MVGGLQRFLGEARHAVAGGLARVAGLGGRRLLSREGTARCIGAVGHVYEPGRSLRLKVGDRGVRRLEVLPTGLVRMNGRDCLDLDYGTRSGLLGWGRPRRAVDRVAAVWSHRWGGYYHWMLDVLPKIVQLQAEVGEDLGGFHLTVPLAGATYEAETLRMLRVPSDRVIDPWRESPVEAGEIWCMPLPGWERLLPQIQGLRDRLVREGTAGVGERIYVSRAGRRRLENEAEIFSMLERHGFVFVEDRPRSIPEQIGIFRAARWVVGPHGAAFTNLLWCESGTRVVELIGGDYAPGFYRALSGERQLTFDRVVGRGRGVPHWTAMGRPIRIEPESLEPVLAGRPASDLG